jgi:hypothetical protein
MDLSFYADPLSRIIVAIGNRLDYWRVEVRVVPVVSRIFYSPRRPYQILRQPRVPGPFLGSKAAGMSSWPLTSNYCQRQ